MVRVIYIILAFIIVLPAWLAQPAQALAQAGDASQLIAEVNSLRAAYGLPAYQVNHALMSAAQQQSDYQAQIGSWTHTGPGGSSPHDRAVAAGYGGGTQVYVSENVATGVDLATSRTVHEMWQDAVHLETMISSNYTHIGAGVGHAGDWVYYTIVVGYISGSPGSGSEIDVAPPASAVNVAPTPTSIQVEPIAIATPGADGSIVHVVKLGQFLENIAGAYEVNLPDLLVLNGLTEQSVIFPGELILIQTGQTPKNTQEILESEIESEIVEASLQTAIPTDRPKASTPSPVPVALNNPPESNSLQIEPTEDVGSNLEDEPGINFLLYVVFGLALAGMVLILLGSTLKKRS